jgi:hypothetical protein
MTLGFLRGMTRVEKRSTDDHGGESEQPALIGPAGGLLTQTQSTASILRLPGHHRCHVAAACLAEAQSIWVEGENKGT